MQNKIRGVSHVKLPSEGYRAIGVGKRRNYYFLLSGVPQSRAKDFWLHFYLFFGDALGSNKKRDLKGHPSTPFGNSLWGSAGIVWEVYRGFWLRI